MYKIMSSANSDTFMSYFLVFMTFIAFFCQIALARTSVTVFYRSGESEHPCLIPDFRGKGFSFIANYDFNCEIFINSFNQG